jgi:hypothetical protein
VQQACLGGLRGEIGEPVTCSCSLGHEGRREEGRSSGCQYMPLCIPPVVPNVTGTASPFPYSCDEDVICDGDC